MIAFESFSLWQLEAFPTLLRSRAYTASCFIGRIVSALACFASFVQTRHPLELESAIGVIGVVVALLAITIPETLNEPLPQSMAEVKALKKKTKLALWPMT